MRRRLLAENINAKHSERVSNTVILMRGMCSSIFFFKNRIKNQYLFFAQCENMSSLKLMKKDHVLLKNSVQISFVGYFKTIFSFIFYKLILIFFISNFITLLIMIKKKEKRKEKKKFA